MWKAFRTLGMCATLFALGVAKNGNGQEHHGPLIPDCCELDADYEWFEPIHCDCSDDYESHQGMFFTYERVNWAVMSAPRYPVGQGGLRVSSSVLVDNDPEFEAPTPFLLAPTPTEVSNAIDVSQPDSEFGWGNRFEFGYSQDNVGWTVGVLANLDAGDTKTYGVDVRDLVDEDGNFLVENPQTFTGSVAVMFQVPENLLLGFVDPDTNSAPTDVNSNGQAGPLQNPTDFGDLVAFVPSFNALQIDHRTEANGVELMRTVRRDNFYFRQTTVEFLYGLRFLRVDNEMRALGVGGLLADSNWASEVENKMWGPQVGMRWQRTKGRWAIRTEGRFTAAMNIRDASLEGTMGSLLQPSRVNNPLYFNPTSFAQYDSDIAFSPLGEGRLEAVFNVTQKFALKVGYTGTYASNMGYGSNMVNYTLPGLTLRNLDDIDTQHFFANGVNFGFEINR
jgi:hypothetical protein